VIAMLNRDQPGRRDLVEGLVDRVHASNAPVVAPVALVKACDAAWAAYRSACRFGGTGDERGSSFERALAAERQVWVALGVDAGRAT
jgi:hypothetical protein